ncbi:GntR family transcriptional regulator [Actinopolyspora mortivallis]|uniref:GntR family transcriptional regulator n=1 Tax=Actinopolyspora mortivallis TaxID=33906 RepID=UPI002159015E|nr:GntR family transcriptional regulator [Actinopolyspora mortivallis]
MELSLGDPVDGPLHERVAAAVRRAVASGELVRGSRLPTARELADRFGVNTNTVLRGYRQLSGEGLIELRRGRGAVVVGEADLARLNRLVDELLAEAARVGMSRGELVALLTRRS